MKTIEQEYAETRPKSRARQSMPSGVAHDGRAITPFPFYVERADGPRKWDVDGHAYLACWSGHGALILGHNHPAVLRAITEQTALAIRVARAATGRSRIIKFRGHFHGVHDAVVSGVKDPFELPMTAG